MRRLIFRTLAGFALIASLLCILKGVTQAAPALVGANCITTCADKPYFINGSGYCFTYTPADCADCGQADPFQPGGKCNAEYVDPIRCVLITGQRTVWTIHPSGSCDTPCSAVQIDGRTEATEPTQPNFDYGVSGWFSCLLEPA